jgi:hypothetical protein
MRFSPDIIFFWKFIDKLETVVGMVFKSDLRKRLIVGKFADQPFIFAGIYDIRER